MMIKFEYLTDLFEIKGGLQALVIENKPLYRRVTETFHNDTAGDLFVLSENFTPIDMKKSICYIGDIFDLSYSDRKLITKLSVELEQTANEILFSEILSVTEKLNIIGRGCPMSLISMFHIMILFLPVILSSFYPSNHGLTRIPLWKIQSGL